MSAMDRCIMDYSSMDESVFLGKTSCMCLCRGRCLVIRANNFHEEAGQEEDDDIRIQGEQTIFVCTPRSKKPPELKPKSLQKSSKNSKGLQKLGPPAASAQGGLRYPAGVCRELAEWHPQGVPTSANPKRSSLEQSFRSAKPTAYSVSPV